MYRKDIAVEESMENKYSRVIVRTMEEDLRGLNLVDLKHGDIKEYATNNEYYCRAMIEKAAGKIGLDRVYELPLWEMLKSGTVGKFIDKLITIKIDSLRGIK